MWLVKMPTAPAIGSIISVSFPDSMVHKVVRDVHFECLGAEIYPSEVKDNRNEYPEPWNPNGYPDCTVTAHVTDAR